MINDDVPVVNMEFIISRRETNEINENNEIYGSELNKKNIVSNLQKKKK